MVRLDRRDLLRRAAAGAAFLTGSQHAAAQESPYGPFKMGIQSYSLRGYRPLERALKQTQALKIGYWEAWDGHIPQTADAADVKMQLRAADVRLLAYGVVGFGADAAANRRLFEFARRMEIPVISADPAPEALAQLNDLVREFDLRIAIHNHGPRSRYDRLEDVTRALEGRDRRIGACVDTGHYLRSRVDPVKAIETLGDRVYGVHLKDVKDATRFTILGEGDLDLLGVLRALKARNYREVLALEYEEHPEDPMAEIEQCLAAVRKAADQL
jgi:sugar phosphate isomerase/epimerase